MKYIEKNISKIILVFLFMQPLIDVITALPEFASKKYNII